MAGCGKCDLDGSLVVVGLSLTFQSHSVASVVALVLYHSTDHFLSIA